MCEELMNIVEKWRHPKPKSSGEGTGREQELRNKEVFRLHFSL